MTKCTLVTKMYYIFVLFITSLNKFKDEKIH